MILLIYAAIILVGVGLDQLTKYLAASNLAIDASPDVKVWEGVFHIRCISNDGAAFGMLDDQRWVFMSISSIMIVALLAFLVLKYKSISKPLGIALALVISGGIGNMIDRIALGYVVDFIYFVPIDFPCFNAADSFVCIGAGLMFIAVLFFDDPDRNEKKKKTDEKVIDGTTCEISKEPSAPEDSGCDDDTVGEGKNE